MHLLPLLPEISLAVLAMLVLLLGAFHVSTRQLDVLTQAGLGVSAALTLVSTAAGSGSLWYGMVMIDALSQVMKLMLLLATSLALIYGRRYLRERGLLSGEYYALTLFALIGMMVMASGFHLLSLYMGLELLSLSLYTMVALDRDNPRASEAAIKYFVLGALASGMLLYGMSMVYGMTGSLNLADIHHALLGGVPYPSVMVLGLVFIVAGIAFKLGAVPFHMWVPDVYSGAPTAITLWLSSAPKLAVLMLIVRLLFQGLQTMAIDIQQMLMVLAVLSISIGNIAAIAQSNLKRMLAYSGISHIGFMLYGLMSFGLNGLTSALFYLIAYVLMTLAGFGMILWLANKNFEAEHLDDWKGLNQHHPWQAFLMLLVMFSMAGIPPTLGFYAKFTVLQAALQAGFVGLVVFAVLMAVVGAFYYLSVVKRMYFDTSVTRHTLNAPRSMRVVLGVNCLALLALGVVPQALMNLCAFVVTKSLA